MRKILILEDKIAEQQEIIDVIGMIERPTKVLPCVDTKEAYACAHALLPKRGSDPCRAARGYHVCDEHSPQHTHTYQQEGYDCHPVSDGEKVPCGRKQPRFYAMQPQYGGEQKIYILGRSDQKKDLARGWRQVSRDRRDLCGDDPGDVREPEG